MPRSKRAPRKKATKNPTPEPMPKCGVIIRKQPFEEGVRCPEDAIDFVNLVGDDGVSTVAILLLCKRHSEKMDNGKSYILTDGDGNYILANKNLNPTPPPDTLTEGTSPPKSPTSRSHRAKATKNPPTK